MLEIIRDFIFPKRCLFCREFIGEEADICPACWHNLNFINEPFCQICGSKFEYKIADNISCGACIKEPPKYDIARHLLVFDEYSKKMIHKFKYCDQTNLAPVMAKLLWQKYRTEISQADYIMPVPSHWLKRLIRLYNQAQILAYYLARIANKPIQNPLRKIKWSKAQSKLSREARKRNLRGSFMVIDKKLVKNKNIILVDDVYTTGSTVNICAQKLHRAGARHVMVLTIAKTHKLA